MNFAKVSFQDRSCFIIEVASTAQQRARGLANRNQCGAGMIFVFPTIEPHPMWMYRMRFPIDIIWILSNVAVDVFGNAQPCTGECPPLGDKRVNSLYVLEIPVGSIKAHRVQVGSVVQISLLPPVKCFLVEGIRLK